MNIHLPAILGFTRCQGFDPFAIFFHHFCPPNVQKGRQWFERQIAGALGAAAPLAPWSAHGSGGGECLGWKRAGNGVFFFPCFSTGFSWRKAASWMDISWFSQILPQNDGKHGGFYMILPWFSGVNMMDWIRNNVEIRWISGDGNRNRGKLRQLQPQPATPTAPSALQVLLALGRHGAGQANGGGGRIDALAEGWFLGWKLGGFWLGKPWIWMGKMLDLLDVAGKPWKTCEL